METIASYIGVFLLGIVAGIALMGAWALRELRNLEREILEAMEL